MSGTGPPGPMARVAHLTTVHRPDDVRISLKECPTLAHAGFSVTLLGPAKAQPRLVPGFSFVPIGLSRGRVQRMTVFTFRMLRAARALRADLYHFHDPELIPVGLALKLTGARVVYDVHEDVPRQLAYKEYLGPIRRRVLASIAEVVELLAARALDGIVAATPRIAARFPKRKTVVVQNFPLIEEFPAPEASRSDPPLVAYVGRLTPEAGALVMARAAAIAASREPLRFVFAGPALSEVDAEIRQVAGDAEIELPGWVDRGEVMDLLSRAQVGLVLFQPVANYVEAYPTKLFEYMLAGVPVVASDFPLWREIVEKARCGILTDPEDAEAVADAILRLLHDPRREAMGSSGHEAVVEDYRWEPQGQRLVSMYWRLLGRPGHRAVGGSP